MPIFFIFIHVAEAARRHTKPLNIDLIFMDVMCCNVGMISQACARA
jgi:hypothetical protein